MSRLGNNKLCVWASLVAQMVKNPPAVRKAWVLSLGWEDPLEKGTATHSSILAWRIPLTGEPGRLQSMGLQRVDMMSNFHFLLYLLYLCCFTLDLLLLSFCTLSLHCLIQFHSCKCYIYMLINPKFMS